MTRWNILYLIEETYSKWIEQYWINCGISELFNQTFQRISSISSENNYITRRSIFHNNPHTCVLSLQFAEDLLLCRDTVIEVWRRLGRWISWWCLLRYWYGDIWDTTLLSVGHSNHAYIHIRTHVWWLHTLLHSVSNQSVLSSVNLDNFRFVLTFWRLPPDYCTVSLMN